MHTNSTIDKPQGQVETFAFDITSCIVFDLEVYPNRWCVGFYGPNADGGMRHNVTESLMGLRLMISRLRERGRIAVGFNSQRFDEPLLRAILANLDPYKYAQEIIAEDRVPSDLRRLPRIDWDHIDLCARVKRGKWFSSLKTLAAALGRPTLRELPFDPTRELTDEEWAEVKAYNRIDLEHTWAVLERFAPELQALATLSEGQGSDFRSVQTAQVVERVYAKNYVRAYGIDPALPSTPDQVLYRPVEGIRRPRTPEAAAWFDRIVRPLPFARVSQGIRVDVPRAEFAIGSVKLIAKQGGLHSVDQPKVEYATRKTRLVSVDVASYYPTLMASKGISPSTYGELGAQTYRDILARRLEVKQQAKAATDPAERERLEVQAHGLKIVLNSTFGKLGDPYSSLYDPAAFLAVTLSGQLMLIDLIERLTEAKVRVLTVNTDGLVLRVHRGAKRWRKILARWENDTGMTLEIDPLERLVMLATNCYATLGPKGKVKRKGAQLKGHYTLNPVSYPNNLVIADAVSAALLMDVPPEVTVWGCADPVRFCRISRRTGKVIAAHLVDEGTGEEVELPKITRCYKAKDSRQYLRHRFADGHHTTPPGATGIRLALDLSDGVIPEDLDRSWYIAEARRIVQRLGGYRHRATKRLQDHPLAMEVKAAGLCPCPKWGGKAVLPGADPACPTWLWEWGNIKTVGTYTGPTLGIFVLDVDEFPRFAAWVEANNQPLMGNHWDDLRGCLVSVHGETAAADVRTGRGRGKLIFRLDGRDDLAKLTIGKWKRDRGVEIFYGRGIPSILGAHSDGENYRLEGTFGPAPDWLVDGLVSKPGRKPSRNGKAHTRPFSADEISRVAESPSDEPKTDPKVDDYPEVRQSNDLDDLKASLAGLAPELRPELWRRKEYGDRIILVGPCPFEHDSASKTDADLSAGFHDDGPYVHCLHQSCSRIREIDGWLRGGSSGPVESTVAAEPEDQGDDADLAFFPHTDLGNAERMVRRFGWKIRHCHPWKRWLHFDGRRWAADDIAAVRRMARDTARKILKEAATVEDKEHVESLIKLARATESVGRLGAMVSLASAEKNIPIRPGDLDTDPWLFNVMNGTIDLRTGELMPHRRTDFITALAPVHFDPDARCPRWDGTLDKFFAEKKELIGFIDRLHGIALTGDVSEQILPIHHGEGDNAKSTILGAMIGLMGPDYATIAPKDFIASGKTNRHPTELAYLYGKRLVVVMEWPEGVRLNESLIKQLTGSDPITARRMNEDFWTFNPTHKLWLCSNHKPVIKGTDHAIWRRPKLIPYDVKILENDKVPNFPMLLKAEYPGILARAVRGCLDWRKNKLRVPTEVSEATKKYRTEQNDIGDFLDECCEVGADYDENSTDLYTHYKTFTGGSGEHPMTQKRFGIAMEDRRFERYKNSGYRYRGIRLRQNDEKPNGKPF